jgi:DNA modification methylase
MQKALLDFAPADEAEAGLQKTRQRLDDLLKTFKLDESDYTFLDSLLATYAQHPSSGAESFARQLVSYVKNCLTQPHKNKSDANNLLKRMHKPLESTRQLALRYAKQVLGEEDLCELEEVEGEEKGSADKKARSGRRANDLDGATWLKYSLSVWDDITKTQDEYAYGHPAMFPSELPDRLIRMFTTSDCQHTVLDPFAGSGSTLVAAVNNGQRGIGFEIYDDFIGLAEARLTGTFNFSEQEREFQIIKDDARNLSKYLGPQSVDLCITSPPYWNILGQKRTADYKEIKRYGDHTLDLGEIADYRDFLVALKEVFAEVFVAMKPGSYCVVNVMDLRKQSKFYAYHIDVATFMQEIGFELDDLIIWNRAKEYNNLRPLGYPFVFRINKVHEFVLIFRVPKAK